MLHITKLLALFTLLLSCFSCESEKRTSQKSASLEKSAQIDVSHLKQQISLMLRGKPHDEAVLRAAMESHGWDETKRSYRMCMDTYIQEHGKHPEKDNIINAHSLLDLIQADIELAQSERAKAKSLEELEKTIRGAVGQ